MGATTMPVHITKPVRVTAVGTPPKTIEEFVGVASTGGAAVSVARMSSPPGWSEPGQRPEFREITVVLEGCLEVACEDGSYAVAPGEAILVEGGEWVRYSTPVGAEYVAICLPAFTLDTVHRDEEP
jgi:quercetin dioxygenase-like cupin family protein